MTIQTTIIQEAARAELESIETLSGIKLPNTRRVLYPNDDPKPDPRQRPHSEKRLNLSAVLNQLRQVQSCLKIDSDQAAISHLFNAVDLLCARLQKCDITELP